MNDQKLNKKIHRQCHQLPIKNFSLKINNGIVTITGEAPNYQTYLTIGENIAKIKGVTGIVNTVTYPGYQSSKKKPGSPDPLGSVDVVIIGAGVTGCAIARELSKYKISIALVEKAEDVACGATKANNAMVHSGIGETPGTLKQKLCVSGHFKFPPLAKDLNVPYISCGMYIIITSDSLKELRVPTYLKPLLAKHFIPWIIKRRGKKMGLPIKQINKKDLLKTEPHVTPKALLALSSPTYGVTSPYEFTIALAENACKNGVKLYLNTEVVDFTIKDNTITSVITTKGTLSTKFVINAAGVDTDGIANLAGTQEFTIHPRKGSIILFDKESTETISHNLSYFRYPSQTHTKGGGIMMTTHGNIQWGPTAIEQPHKYDTSVTHKELHNILNKYRPLLPAYPTTTLITYFAGVRAPTFTEDFIIRPAYHLKGFIHAAGIQSPGLAAAPAIAELVVEILKKEKLHLHPKKDFNPYRSKPIIMHELTYKERQHHIKNNPLYGRIVCRCEQISEGEIIDAIHRPIPALTLDAIKRRTRAGMGRCQSGFCLPRVAKILARETNTPIEKILKNTQNSQLFIGKAKCLFTEEKQ
jgi:glycerol-3-phosphate dehydrogenase